MKYLFIELQVQNGEFEHTERILHTTTEHDINLAAEEYVGGFYSGEGEKEHMSDWWTFFGGSIAARVKKVIELSKTEYNFLYSIFYDINLS